MSPELQAAFDAAIGKAVREHSISIDKLTEHQVCEVLKQAIACGDFQRFLAPDGAQAVCYIPHNLEQRLLLRINRLRGTLMEISQYRSPIVGIQEVQAMAELALTEDDSKI